MKRLLPCLDHLPRHPFRLARAVITQPLIGPAGPRAAADLPDWTERSPVMVLHASPIVATGIHARLRREGWRALICREEASALALCEAISVSLIVCGADVLADQRGLWLALSQSRAGRAIPVLALPVPGHDRPTLPDLPPRPVIHLMDTLGGADFVTQARDLLLRAGHWCYPPGYSAARAARALRDHVYAR